MTPRTALKARLSAAADRRRQIPPASAHSAPVGAISPTPGPPAHPAWKGHTNGPVGLNRRK